jgi:hypothetical protein
MKIFISAILFFLMALSVFAQETVIRQRHSTRRENRRLDLRRQFCNYRLSKPARLSDPDERRRNCRRQSRQTQFSSWKIEAKKFVMEFKAG